MLALERSRRPYARISTDLRSRPSIRESDASEQEQSKQKELVDAKAKDPKITIALADDHAMFRESMRLLLGCEPDFQVVAEAANAQDTWSMIEEHEPDILLLDLRMPTSDDSFLLLEQLNQAQFKTKVVVLTGSEDERDYIQAVKLGSRGVVLKRSPTSRLIDGIRKVQKGSFCLDSTATSAVVRQFAALPGSNSINTKDATLTFREREVISFVKQGLRNKEIAEKLFLTEQTIKNHLRCIFQKLGVTDRTELAHYAESHNIRPF